MRDDVRDAVLDYIVENYSRPGRLGEPASPSH